MNVPSFSTCRHIKSNLLAYPPTTRGELSSESLGWLSQRDQRVHLRDFETIEFREVQKCLVVPLYANVTIDDDLYGTRAAVNKVKTLEHRKAVAEGYVADRIDDVLHEVKFDVRFRRRGDKKESAAALELYTIVETRGEIDRNSFFMTVDCGYGRP